MPDTTSLDYVNFNCWSWDGDNTSPEGLRANFERQFQHLESQFQEVYNETYNSVLDKMPFRNHALSQEQAHVSAWMNIVMETYSSDNTVALSEKTFRALCLPVPWQLYSGRHTVARLASLGFDTLADTVTHRYDSMIENRTAAYGDKMVDFLFEATENTQQFQQQDIADRCVQAAEHNIALLQSMQQQWPIDFAAWWPGVLEKIQ
jgi:cation transport regulator ChaB